MDPVAPVVPVDPVDPLGPDAPEEPSLPVLNVVELDPLVVVVVVTVHVTRRLFASIHKFLFVPEVTASNPVNVTTPDAVILFERSIDPAEFTVNAPAGPTVNCWSLSLSFDTFLARTIIRNRRLGLYTHAGMNFQNSRPFHLPIRSIFLTY